MFKQLFKFFAPYRITSFDGKGHEIVAQHYCYSWKEANSWMAAYNRCFTVICQHGYTRLLVAYRDAC
jgi:hypothetical protein